LQSIAELFPNRGLGRPFVAGFGNRHTDEVSYAAVDVPPDRVFTIDPSGTLKMGTGYVVPAGPCNDYDDDDDGGGGNDGSICYLQFQLRYTHCAVL
jgi:hypothetical protein